MSGRRLTRSVAVACWAAVLAAAAPPARAAAAPPASDPDPRPALLLAQGSTASRELVAIGQDLVVAGEARADAVAIGGSILVSGKVAGDVIVLDGSVRLAPTAVVEGDAYVLGGSLEVAPGAILRGRGAAYPTVAGTLLALLEGPAVGVDPLSPVVLGTKLGLLAAWLAATMLGLVLAGGAVLATSQRAAHEPLRDFLTGLTAVFTFALSGLFLASLVPAVASVPLLGLLLVAALMLKIFGMVALFHRCGEWLGRRLLRRRPQPLPAAVTGALVLGAVKLVPWVGIWLWTALSLVAVGVSLRALLARREPQLEAADLQRLASLVR